MLIFSILIGAMIIGILVFVNFAPQFGKIPDGKDLTRVEESVNFWNGKFQNPVKTEINMDVVKASGVRYNWLEIRSRW